MPGASRGPTRSTRCVTNDGRCSPPYRAGSRNAVIQQDRAPFFSLPAREGLGVGTAEGAARRLPTECTGRRPPRSRARHKSKAEQSTNPRAPDIPYAVDRPPPDRNAGYHRTPPKPRLATCKINNERRHHQLPRKGGPIPRNQMPDRSLGRCRIVTQLPCPSRHFRIDTPQHMASVARLATLANPPPTPPLQGGARRKAMTGDRTVRSHRNCWKADICARSVSDYTP